MKVCVLFISLCHFILLDALIVTLLNDVEKLHLLTIYVMCPPQFFFGCQIKVTFRVISVICMSNVQELGQ